MAGARVGVLVGNADISCSSEKSFGALSYLTFCYNAAFDVLTPENLVDVKERIAILKEENIYQRLRQSSVLTKFGQVRQLFIGDCKRGG
ncbi:MAG: hypothetical protein IPK86_04410 [Neisseriales bacterium]|nr:MAG: hypothetical protein IPK86_04410 [Neisseriales bacterium]